MVDGQCRAIEGVRAIGKALSDWRAIVAHGSETRPGIQEGVFWRPDFGYWGFFGRTAAGTELGWRYWNAFGREPVRPKQNMLVEINPPQSGVAGGVQGLFAKDADGKRWVLHGGRLHPSGTRISSERFGEISSLAPVTVHFSDGSTRPYFVVGPLDHDEADLHAWTARFISECEQVRLFYAFGPEEAEAERRITEAEGESHPEKSGQFGYPQRPGGIGNKTHADVWKALVVALDKRSVKHTNSRVGRFGPDLRTVGDRGRLLFEIKTNNDPRSAYEALGQLTVYEKLLGRTYQKVIVLPDLFSARMQETVVDLGIAVIRYRPRGSGYVMEGGDLEALLANR